MARGGVLTDVTAAIGNANGGPYYNSLTADSRRRYDDKIAGIKRDPYEIPLKDFSTERKDWPDVTYINVVNYLIFNVSGYTKEQFKHYKSMDAYKIFQDGWLKDILHLKIEGFHLMRAKVHHSMRIREKPLEPWVILSSDGTVQYAHCTCMAGLGEGCSHVGAVLFGLETATRIRNEASVTDVPAYWLFPTATTFNTPYKQVRDIDFSSASKKRKRLNDEIEGCRDTCSTPPKCEVSSPTKTEMEHFMDKLHAALPKAAVLSLTDKFCLEFKPKSLTMNLPMKLTTLFDCNRTVTSYDDVLQFCNAVNIDFTDAQATTVEHETRKQSMCKLWQQMRTGRITASVFYDVCHTSLDKPSVSLLKKICCPAEQEFFSKATDYGKRNEKTALKEYKTISASRHTNFKCDDCGLCLNTDFPRFGASPDSLVSCSCCGEGCVEIKCPFKLKDMYAPDIVWMGKTENGQWKLKQNSKHYYQVQMQLFVANKSYCDFVVWSPHFLHLERICRNSDFWAVNADAANDFHKHCIMPELVCKYFTTKPGNRDVGWCICGGNDDGSKMIMCDGENCSNVWYHMKCIKLKRAPRGKWYCSECNKVTSVN